MPKARDRSKPSYPRILWGRAPAHNTIQFRRIMPSPGVRSLSRGISTARHPSAPPRVASSLHLAIIMASDAATVAQPQCFHTCQCGQQKLAKVVPLRRDTSGGLQESTYWPRTFIQREEVDRRSFNTPLIDRLGELWEKVDKDEDNDGGADDDSSLQECFEKKDCQAGDGNEPGSLYNGEESIREDYSIARIFMRERLHMRPSESLEEYQKQAEHVENYCSHITLEDLKERKGALQDSELLAILDQSSRVGKYRQKRGKISSQQLHEMLRDNVSLHVPIERMSSRLRCISVSL